MISFADGSACRLRLQEFFFKRVLVSVACVEDDADIARKDVSRRIAKELLRARVPARDKSFCIGREYRIVFEIFHDKAVESVMCVKFPFRP